MPDGNLVSSFLKGGFTDLLGSEELVADALKDLVREELRTKMRAELDANPELRDELHEAVKLYFEAKVREAYATIRFVKASAKLGVRMMPPEMRDELGKELGTIIEREVSALLEKAV